MKKILSNQKGVTLIETIAASVIVVLLLLTVLGALMFGQGVIVGNDEKNNAAATAQDMIDTIMVALSSNTTDGIYKDVLVSGAKNLRTNSDFASAFVDPGVPGDTDYTPEQYYINPVYEDGSENINKEISDNNEIAYKIYVRVYYNQGKSYVDLTAYNKRGGVWD